jgi:hypothetical protein
MDTGVITRTSRSVLFIIPWGRHWLIGTTDTPHDDGPDEPVAAHTDVAYLLDQANAVLRTPLTRDDIKGVYAGLRPLLSAEADDTARMSREHAVAEPVPGLVVVTGGKFTTYRVMARDAVDAVAASLDDAVPESVTARLPLLGAVGFEVLWNERRRLAAASGLHVARVEHLLRRYGTCAREVLDLVADDPALAAPSPARTTTCARRPSTRRRTRAPCTWRTSWPGGCGSRSRSGTAASRPPPTSPASSRTGSAGARTTSPTRSSGTSSRSRRSGAAARPSPSPNRRSPPSRGVRGS